MIFRKKKKLDSMVVLNQPKHQIVTIIQVNSEISDKEHDIIDKVRESSDIVFLFNTDSKISTRAFSKLYFATSYMERDDINTGLMDTLMYCKCIFKQDIALITSTDKIGLVDYNKLVSGLQKATNNVIKIDRLSCDELKEVYTNYNEEGDIKLNSLYKTESNIIAILNIGNFLTPDFDSIEFKEYIKTFKEPSFNYMLPSYIKYKDLDYINEEVTNL